MRLFRVIVAGAHDKFVTLGVNGKVSDNGSGAQMCINIGTNDERTLDIKRP